MNSGISDRVVVITGASGGIGQQLVRSFVDEGARVAIHYRTNQAAADELRAGLTDPSRAICLPGDLSQPNDVESLFAGAERALGPVQTLIANAGRWPPDYVPIHAMSLEQWDRTLATNLSSVFLCARRFFQGVERHRLADPSAVLIGSTAAQVGEAGHVDYAASKAAIVYGMLPTLKNELARLAPRGRVNAICPGWTLTPMTEKFAGNEPQMRRALQTIALRKFGRPSDVAAAAVFLASPTLSGHISGQVLTTSGGMEGRVLYDASDLDTAMDELMEGQ